MEKGRKASLFTKFPSASRKWLGLNWCGVSHCVLSSSTEVSDGITIIPWKKIHESSFVSKILGRAGVTDLFLCFALFSDTDVVVPGDLTLKVLSHQSTERDISEIFPAVPRIEAKCHVTQ